MMARFMNQGLDGSRLQNSIDQHVQVLVSSSLG